MQPHSKGGTFVYDRTGKLISHTPGTAELSPEQVKAQARAQAIVEAVKKLDRTDKSLWIKTGAPRVPAIEALFGGQISEAERDAAWTQVNEGAAP